MRYRCILALLTAGIASPQSIQKDLITYLKLTSDQVQSINQANQSFFDYITQQTDAWYGLEYDAQTQLAQDSPDASVVGND